MAQIFLLQGKAGFGGGVLGLVFFLFFPLFTLQLISLYQSFSIAIVLFDSPHRHSVHISQDHWEALAIA